MNYMEEVEKIHKHYKKDVTVHCSEYHAHSAISGCLTGDEHSIVICKLCEIANILYGKMLHAQETLKVEE